MLVLPVTTYMIIINNILLVSSEYTVDLRHKISLQSCQIYFLGSVKPELHSRHIPTPTSFLENGRGGPPIIYGKRPDTYLTDSTQP